MRLNGVTIEAQARGEELADFLEKRPTFITEEDYATYLRLRGIRRYTVHAYYFGLIIFELPADRLPVMYEVSSRRATGQMWAVRPLKWWQLGRSINVDEACRLVP